MGQGRIIDELREVVERVQGAVLRVPWVVQVSEGGRVGADYHYQHMQH